MIILFCSGCQYKVPDVNGCVQRASGGAFCQTLVSQRQTFISRRDWSRVKTGTVCYTPEDSGRIIEFIEVVCNDTQNCVKDIDERIEKGRDFVGVR